MSTHRATLAQLVDEWERHRHTGLTPNGSRLALKTIRELVDLVDELQAERGIQEQTQMVIAGMSPAGGTP